jgi:DNA integrity scanning protein DisA with diadenylate cyclase activity
LPDVDALWEIVKNATRRKHGTMIVVSSDAAEEAKRLEVQSTVLRNPVRLTEEVLLMLSSIDGAVLVDSEGICHAAGVILDGEAVRGKGTKSSHIKIGTNQPWIIADAAVITDSICVHPSHSR